MKQELEARMIIRILFRATIARLTRKKHNLVNRGETIVFCTWHVSYTTDNKILVTIESTKLLVDRFFQRN